MGRCTRNIGTKYREGAGDMNIPESATVDQLLMTVNNQNTVNEVVRRRLDFLSDLVLKQRQDYEKLKKDVDLLMERTRNRVNITPFPE